MRVLPELARAEELGVQVIDEGQLRARFSVVVDHLLRELLPAQLASGKDLETGTHFYVKSPVFPWSKFAGADMVLVPEMRSTGEVMGISDSFGASIAKSQIAASNTLPTEGTIFFSVNHNDKTEITLNISKIPNCRVPVFWRLFMNLFNSFGNLSR